MWRTFVIVLTLSLQIAAWPQRQGTKKDQNGDVHNCWAENGNVHEECEFPFEYQGKSNNKCMPYGDKYWCATTTSYTENPGKWGYCNQCDRVKYWKYEWQTDDSESSESSEEATTSQSTNRNTNSATVATDTAAQTVATCAVEDLSGCQTCRPSGAKGGNCQSSFRYNYITYGGCDKSLVQDGKPFCLYSENLNDWGYCNPETCPSKKAVGSHNTAATQKPTSKPKQTSQNSRTVPSNEYYSKGTPSAARDEEKYYLKAGRPWSECVGGALLFDPRPCGRDCRSVMGINVDCDGVKGCACPEGKYWAENQGRCVSEEMCHHTNVYQIKRPCGMTYSGMYRCQYPFSYQGKEHNACAEWKGRLWCSLDKGVYETHRRWGYCEGLIGRDENKCPPAPSV